MHFKYALPNVDHFVVSTCNDENKIKHIAVMFVILLALYGRKQIATTPIHPAPFNIYISVRFYRSWNVAQYNT